MANHDIAKYNEDIDETCNYCKAVGPTANHIRWQCKYFDAQRQMQCPELAAVPYKDLLHCIQCGVAPAVKVAGEPRRTGEPTLMRTPMRTRRPSSVKAQSCIKEDEMPMKHKEGKNPY